MAVIPSIVSPQEMSPVRRPLFLAASPVGKDGRPIIQRLLIANRGEIAVRIIQTCRRLNIASVAVYVEEDASSRHVHDADEAICIGSVGRSDSNPFLDMDLLIQTALRAQVQAVHPGYGYLSENADFARRVRQAGLIFIGPGASAMSSLGDKRSAKEYLRKHAPDVPLIPGFAGSSQSVDVLAAAAEEIGLPVMVKASAGGGGKGMRIVREAKQLKSELERAKSEAQRAFGSSDCILEKYIECGKHVEIQIIGDRHGEVVSFLDRDCSVQRRHQKVIEETPCPFLSDETRRKMSATAVRIAKLIGYENAGTVEFVVDVTSGKFYFLEVNARLQVEHPITEEVTGFDLVSLQLFVAAGGKLQGLPTVTQQGHAIECRLCAEDPQNNFFPEHGMVHLWRPADGLLSPGRDIRYETAIHTGSEVSIYFDSMIAKIVVWAPTREMAIDKMTRVLANTACVGVKTNQLFLQRCLLHREFHRPTYTTSFIPSYFNELTQTPTTCVTGLYSIVPSVVIRTLPKPSSPARRPFQMIRSQFRNQHHDPVNVHCDIITTVNGPGATSPMMCVWQPVAAGTSRQICEVHLTPVPNDSLQPQKEADSVTTAQYNAISNGLRQKIDNSTSFHHVYMESCQMIEGYNTTSQSCNTFTTVVSINRTKILGHVVIPSISSHPVAGLVDQPQRVFCHFPSLGTWIEFQRDTLLSFGEASRSAGKAEKESQTRVILAPMPCKLLSIDKKNGDEVAAGETLMVIESMKMEVNITASISGKFQTDWKKGDAVDEGKVLCSVL